MKAMLLRIGIDKGTDRALGPIFNNRSFEYIPLSEKDVTTKEQKTFGNTKGQNGVYLSKYLPERIKNRKLHFDPEFETYTYGDQTVKRNYLLKLEKGDFLVFYAGLTPYKTNAHEEGLYIIGYFQVDTIVDFNCMNTSQKRALCELYKNNAHIKFNGLEDLVIIKGHKETSKLLDKSILISKKKLNIIRRKYYVVSPELEELLGISGSIQRSIPPRFVRGIHMKNLIQMLDLNL